MKKQMLTCFSMLLCLGTAYAQPQKGRTLLGGSFNGSSRSNEGSYTAWGTNYAKSWKNKSHSFNIGPDVDYFISDKSSLGVGIDFGYLKESYKDFQPDSTTINSKTNSYRISFNHTRYFPLKGPLYLGLKNSVAGSLSSKKEPIRYDRKDLKENSTDIGYHLNLGLVYFASDRLVLNTYVYLLGLNYQRSKSTYKGRDYDPLNGYSYSDKKSKSQGLALSGINTFGLGSITVGIQYYLGKKASTEEVK